MHDTPPGPHRPLLWLALNLNAAASGPPVVAIVGGGGKTSLLYRLGRDADALGLLTVICGTTRYTRAPNPHATPPVLRDLEQRLPERIRDAWADGATTVVASGTDEGAPDRLVAIAPETVGAIAGLQGLGGLLVEADGSRQLPFKAPAPHEPVIPASATHVIAIVGLDALDAPLDEVHVHRPDRVRAICDRPTCDADLIARTLASPQGGRQYVANRTFAVVVNKSDLAPGAARTLAERLIARGIPRVVVARLADEGAPVDLVLTTGTDA